MKPGGFCGVSQDFALHAPGRCGMSDKSVFVHFAAVLPEREARALCLVLGATEHPGEGATPAMLEAHRGVLVVHGALFARIKAIDNARCVNGGQA